MLMLSSISRVNPFIQVGGRSKILSLSIIYLLSGLIAATLFIFPVSPARADASYVVTNPLDNGNNSAPDAGSLRDAIVRANSHNGQGGQYFITFQLPNPSVPVTITLKSALPNILVDLNITGPMTGGVAISGADKYRPFWVEGQKATGKLTIQNMTVTHGYDSFGGGAIWSRYSTLNVINSTISYSRAAKRAGGIFNDIGTTNIINSTLYGNTIYAAGNQYSGDGGGAVFVHTYLSDSEPSYVNIINSTISGNSVQPKTAGQGASGGGIFNDGGNGRLMIRNSIVAGNTVPSGTGPDIGSGNNNSHLGSYTSQGYNLIGNGQGSVGGPVNGVNGDLVGTNTAPIDPKLGPIQFNGGSTPTMALLTGSPAINIVPVSNCTITVDQRSFARPQSSGSMCDAGAYEVQGASAPVITSQPNSPSISRGQSATLSVTAYGDAPLSYQWYLGASGDTTQPISGATSSSYTTPALSNTTSYWVQVTNSVGSASSNTATVTITSSVTTVDDYVLGTGLNQFNYVGPNWFHCGGGCITGSYNGTVTATDATNEYATIAFSGTQIKLYTDQRNNRGIAAVSIDGGAETNVDMYAATDGGNVLIWTSPVLSAGNHTLKIRNTGTKNASSTGTRIAIDRVDILNS